MDWKIKIIAILLALCIYFSVKYTSISARNTELEGRVTSVLNICSDVKVGYNKAVKERDRVYSQVDQLRPANKSEAVKLRRLLKERNLKYGIGGNL